MRFVELLDGENKILVISAVAPGSTGEKVVSKHAASFSCCAASPELLLAISDPLHQLSLGVTCIDFPAKTYILQCAICPVPLPICTPKYLPVLICFGTTTGRPESGAASAGSL